MPTSASGRGTPSALRSPLEWQPGDPSPSCAFAQPRPPFTVAVAGVVVVVVDGVVVTETGVAAGVA